MNILVTGGAGFIGSQVADAYIASGHEVGVVDDLSTGVKENINSKAKFWRGSITDVNFVNNVINGFKPEVVNHHAAHINVGQSVNDPLFDSTVNINGTINLMQALVKTKSCRSIIFASTGGAMYGNNKTPFTEEMKEAPLSPYGVSKRAAELYFSFYYEQYGIKFAILRYANVYGPRQNPHGEAGVVSIFSKNILENKQPIINGDGKQTRDYIYVEDVVRANELALIKGVSGVFNIGTGIETNVNEIFRLVNHEFSSNFQEIHREPRPGEQQVSSLSYTKAKRVLGWKPHIELEGGIRKTVEWFKKYPKRV